MRPLPLDLMRRVEEDFPEEERAQALEALASYRGREPLRVLRCLLHLAEGSLARLHQACETAKLDYRDTILFAEYDRDNRRLRNFNRPFGQEDGE